MEKLDVELEVIKCKIHEEDLCESFKENLERKLNTRCEAKENVTSEKKNNIIRKPFCFYKAAAVFVCFVMFSSCAFAGGVGHWLRELFSNVDKGMEIAYENGDIKEVETEYQTFDGVSVKVDYVSLKDNELYVVFNVKTEEEYDRIDLNDLLIKDEFENEIFNIENKTNKYSVKRKSIDSRTKLIFVSINKKNIGYDEYRNITMNINSIKLKKDNNIKTCIGEWEISVKLN